MNYLQLTTHRRLIVLIAKLEIAICLIVYFLHNNCCHISDFTMTAINKINLEVLAPVLRRENLIYSLSWMIQPQLSAVNMSKRFSWEVEQDLATDHLFCETTTYQLNWGVSERMVVGTSY